MHEKYIAEVAVLRYNMQKCKTAVLKSFFAVMFLLILCLKTRKIVGFQSVKGTIGRCVISTCQIMADFIFISMGASTFREGDRFTSEQHFIFQNVTKNKLFRRIYGNFTSLYFSCILYFL